MKISKSIVALGIAMILCLAMPAETAQAGSNVGSSSGPGPSTYYYNLKDTSCPSQAKYSKYNLTDVVVAGDLVYEPKAGYGITGHIAIVEAVRTAPNGMKYITIIEAINIGVIRSLLDDNRYDNKEDMCVLHVANATDEQRRKAVYFCQQQLGKPYNLDLDHDTKITEKNWYCSELAWAAYKYGGLDIEYGGIINEPGVTPRDLYRCKNNKKVKISKR